MKKDDLEWLLEWNCSQCDGDWEHKHGVKISTIENPGWRFSISLEGTQLESIPFQIIAIDRKEHDWAHCYIRNKEFQGACGLLNLSEVLQIFRHWAESYQKEDPE